MSFKLIKMSREASLVKDCMSITYTNYTMNSKNLNVKNKHVQNIFVFYLTVH